MANAKEKVNSKVTSITAVKNKQGRLDVLVNGLAGIGLQFLETKTNLPGLASSIKPILEKEISNSISSSIVIPKEYRELAKLIGERLKAG